MKKLFEEVQIAISFEQPKLVAQVKEKCVLVSGTYIVFPKDPGHSEIGPFREYEVKIEIPPDFPFSQPIVYETNGAFPKDVEHHCFTDESCCLGVPLFGFAKDKNYNIDSFFEITLHNYFYGQWCIENGLDWPFGEYSHDADGFREAYSELFNCSTCDEAILPWLTLIMKRKLKPSDLCGCGSGLKVRSCCYSRTKKFFRHPFTHEFRLRLVKQYLDQVS